MFSNWKALYGLKQAPRAWYERLSKFLIKNDFSKGKIITTLFIKHVKQDLLLLQIYVDDIIFGSINETLFKDFTTRMQQEFEMSLIGELNLFLDLLSNKQKMESLSIKESMFMNLWKSSRWKTQRRCLLQWVLLPNLTKMQMVRM